MTDLRLQLFITRTFKGYPLKRQYIFLKSFHYKQGLPVSLFSSSDVSSSVVSSSDVSSSVVSSSDGRYDMNL